MATSIYEFAHLPRFENAPVADARPALRRVRDASEAPLVGVVHNTRSHRNLGRPAYAADMPNVFVHCPGKRSDLPQILGELADRGIDLLVIDGGDGTVRDILTCGQSIFGNDWPSIAVLPKGKTNALTYDLGVPASWRLEDAITALDHGKRVSRRPVQISALDESGQMVAGSSVLGFIVGAGAFTQAIRSGQKAHKLGAFNSFAVLLTALWGVLQSLFASRTNPWRRGAGMEIRLDEQGKLLAHSGLGDPARRQLLFAATLERLPGGIWPFGPYRRGLKLLAIDRLARRTAALIPAAAFGWIDLASQKNGIHQTCADHFTLKIDDQFILDGEAFPAGEYRVAQGPELEFVVP
jgi:diacylglycerol kinase (ATP)